MKERRNRCLKWTCLLIAAGLAYAAVTSLLGFGIPCVFHLLTGLKCPGCGVTRMCLALLQLDFAEAFQQNAVILCLLPLWLVLLVRKLVRYVRTGSAADTRWERICLIGSVIVLLVYGVLRN